MWESGKGCSLPLIQTRSYQCNTYQGRGHLLSRVMSTAVHASYNQAISFPPPTKFSTCLSLPIIVEYIGPPFISAGIPLWLILHIVFQTSLPEWLLWSTKLILWTKPRKKHGFAWREGEVHLTWSQMPHMICCSFFMNQDPLSRIYPQHNRILKYKEKWKCNALSWAFSTLMNLDI